MKRRTLIDLFAGAGGLSVGLEKAGFEAILANELVPEYANTYSKNHCNTSVEVGDIRSLAEAGLRKKLCLKRGELDLLAGGPPCQGFSINAPIRSLDDDRNKLFREFMRIADELRPKSILIENVPGIVSLGRGTVVAEIQKTLEKMGYQSQYRILFAGHYGVPQMRFRTIFLATYKDEQPINFPVPKFDAKAKANFARAKELCLTPVPLFDGKLAPQTNVWDAISDLPELESGERSSELDYVTPTPKSKYQTELRGSCEKVYNHSCNGLGEINIKRLKHIPQGGSWRDIPVDLLPKGMKRARRSDHTKRYGRLHPEGMCSTVLTKCDPHWGSFFHPNQDRVISVREAARIQSFPDDYIFYGTITQQYAQVGNAVPPKLATAIGREVVNALDNNGN